MKKLLLFIIRFYQKTISPDHGILKNNHPFGCCRYYPTCSEYGYQAIRKYGALRGSLKALGRILRCNPFSSGGYDPLN